MSKVKVLLVVLAVVAAGAGLYLAVGTSPAPTPKPGVKNVQTADKGKTETAVTTKPKVRRPISAVNIEPAKRPNFDLDAAEEAKLNEAQKQLIAEIRAALAKDDHKSVMRLVRRMQASDEWPDGIPNAVKKEALKALGYFGEKCLPEIVPFLGDLDAGIVSQAVDFWEDAIAELDGDRVIAEQVILASKVITNAESIESIMSEINESTMRPSVAVQVFKEILASGTDVAKDHVLQQVHDYTNDESITSVEQLDKWLEEHPDESDAEEMYGPMEDNAASDD